MKYLLYIETVFLKPQNIKKIADKIVRRICMSPFK